MGMIEIGKLMYDKDNLDLGNLAVLLAMASNKDVELELIRRYEKMGIKSAVTTISGKDLDARDKLVRNVVGLCLNEQIIEKKVEHFHPVLHAVLEAAQSTRCFDAVCQNFRFRTAVLRQDCWFVLCFYGNMGMHEMTSHKTVGLGIQILGE